VLRKLTIRPGISREASQVASEGSWWAANRVRFRGGWPEKLGGWVRDTTRQFGGAVRALHVWAGLQGEELSAAGNVGGLYIRLGAGATYADRTPARQIYTGATGSATAGVAGVVATTATPHGLVAGDWVMVAAQSVDGWVEGAAPVMVGGVPIRGRYMVGTIVSATEFRLLAPAVATSTVSGVALGQITALDVGPAVVAGVSPQIASFWSLADWGETLLASPTRGPLFVWRPRDGLLGPGADPFALQVTNVVTPAAGPPEDIGSLLVAMPQRQVMCLGASAGTATGSYDPMLVRWSDVEDYTSWVASSTNQAGSVRLQGGSKIVGGRVSRGQVLVWTDTSLFGFRYIGQPLIYRVDLLGQNCGLIGPKASAEVGGVVYWMSSDGFFAFRGGAPEQLLCPLWDDVWPRLQRNLSVLCVAGGNSVFNEVWFFYPADNAGDVSRYVAFDTVAGTWHGGEMNRTAWLDRGVQLRPLAATALDGSRIYQHEVGVDADGAAMGEWIESGWVDIDDGEAMVFVDKLVPDWRRLVGSARLTVRAQDRNDAAVKSRGPAVVVPTTRQVPVRLRGRQMALRIDGHTVPGGDWRLGALRTDAQPDGKL
jgi:hypothetical protein